MALRAKSLEKLRWLLKRLAQLTIMRYRPSVITVTGSVGKTSTKLAISAVLGSVRSARVSQRNYNNEIGVPFSVISGREKVGGPVFWLFTLITACIRIAVKARYPEVLILEYGADRPGDIKYLLEIARPTVAGVPRGGGQGGGGAILRCMWSTRPAPGRPRGRKAGPSGRCPRPASRSLTSTTRR